VRREPRISIDHLSIDLLLCYCLVLTPIHFNRTVITPDMPPIKHGHRFKSSSNHLSPSSSFSSHFRQTPTSVTSNAKMVRGDRFPSHVAHVDELDDERSPEEAIRYALVHLLAIKPFPISVIETRLRMGGKVDKIMPVLTQITTGTNVAGEYCLNRKAYKELEPWEFPYSCQSDRDEAIKAAVQAFDQMRVEKTDSLWDILVKPEERGKGIILSKLNLQEKQFWRSPIIKPQIDRIARNMHEKAQSKGKVANPKNKPDGPKKGEIASSGSSNAKSTTQQRTKLQSTSSGSPLPNTEKPSAAVKSLLNKPKNPSPLAASPVNASELERTHPVHRALSASPTKGSNGAYRAGDTLFGKSKRPPTKRSPIYTPLDNPTKQTSVTKSAEKRKAEDDLEAAPPRKVSRESNIVKGTKRQVIIPPRMKNPTTSSNMPSSNKHTSSYSSAAYVRSSTSESSSPEYELSERQRVKLGAEWKRIYPVYQKKYELVSNKSNPTQAERDELMKLHRKMESMKRQLHSKRI
jgi:RNA polymerase II elongation factor ELL